MALNASQIINNLKKSFNGYVSTALSGATVNYDQDPFDPSGSSSWYSVRYTGYVTESPGVGDFIVDSTDQKGRVHVLNAEISAWSRDDDQGAGLGDMVDKLIVIVETGKITLYDYDDPENPVSIGKFKITPGEGVFTPTWGGTSGGVLKSSSDMHAEHRMKGYVQTITLTTIAEV